MKLLVTYMVLTVTAYSPTIGQTDSTPYIAAWNNPVARCTIAVSRDLEDLGLKKDCFVHIYNVNHCSGIFRVNDRMHWRKRNQFDLFFFDTSQALDFGYNKLRATFLFCKS